MARIILQNVKLFAKIGHLEVEHRVGNHLLVDVAFDTDTSVAEQTDELSDTVDYKVVYDILKAESQQPSKLVEHLAKRMLDALVTTFPQAHNWELSLTKMHPPVNGQLERVSVVLQA
ncbi:MAG: dihydroneopterin aldolase [Flavobacteriales bacterium]|nr:dihydroneopterin aldolase [Flavobacteriales bacterium]MCB9449517.1 dihydroneopterin aldolase [Flavobacteriales bacterium]